MYRTLLFFLALFLLGGCQDQAGNRLAQAIERLVSKRDNDLHVADIVQPPRSGYDRQLPATKLFADLPLTAVIDSVHSRVIVSPHSYINYAYDPGISFEERVLSLQHSADSITRVNPGSIYYTHHFQMGSCKAVLYYGKSQTKGKDELILYFGDRAFTAYAEGEFTSGDKDERKALLKTMLSFYRDEDATEDVSTLMPYTLDLTGTDFAYCTHTDYAFFYTIHGHGSPDVHVDHDQVIVTSLAPVEGSIKNARSEAINMISQAGIVIMSNKDRMINVGGMPSLEMEGRISIGENAGMFYVLLTGAPAQPICIIGVVYKDVEKRLGEVERMGRSFKLKTEI